MVIGLFTAASLAYTLVIPGRWRGWFLFIASVLAIYWRQSFTPLRFADYLLQTITVLLTVLTWWVTRPEPDDPAATGRIRPDRSDALTLLVLFGLVLLVASNRYLAAEWRLTASRPPSPWWVAGGLLAGGGLFALAWHRLRQAARRPLLTAVILLIVLLFALLKAPPLTTAVAAGWRTLTGQQVTLAAPSDLTWLGFSYVAFRLIHTLRDRQTGPLAVVPPLRLREFVTYVLFFPSYVAGPIDRVERFVVDVREEGKRDSVFGIQYSVIRQKGDVLNPSPLPGADYGLRYWQGGGRILIGLFKKFVIADTLALGMSLTAVNAAQATATLWLWVLLYGYALRLFFDFSGYTDIAIGLGMLFGVTLPENFKRPYHATNITAFWQSWHITLSNWARFYVFSPLSRSWLRRQRRPSNTIILFTAHLATMIVIGLWHGITVNYFIWGLWHGLALFAHKQWSDRTRRWYRGLAEKRWQKRTWTAVTWFLTFHYVTLGWVWFTLPTPQLALETFGKLFGIK